MKMTTELQTSELGIIYMRYRSSNQRRSVKKDFLKNFANFTGKHLCWSLYLIKLQAFKPATLLERDFNTGAFL